MIFDKHTALHLLSNGIFLFDDNCEIVLYRKTLFLNVTTADTDASAVLNAVKSSGYFVPNNLFFLGAGLNNNAHNAGNTLCALKINRNEIPSSLSVFSYDKYNAINTLTIASTSGSNNLVVFSGIIRF